MRSTFRGVSLALIAVFAFGALAAASASAALPEFKPEGRKYPVTFTGKGGSVGLQENGGGSYACTGSSMTGEIVGPKQLANVVLKFTGGCSGFCRQTGEEWKTKPLNGTLGYLSQKYHTVGLLLEAATEPVATCEHLGRGTFKVEGSFISELGPTNSFGKSFTLRAQQKEGRQAIQSFEGESLVHNLKMSSPATNLGLEYKQPMELTTAEYVRIEA
jgi:hypothetical protein